MKQAILIAALTTFVLSLNLEANAQVFQKDACYSTGCQRVGLFPRLGIFSRCRYTTYAQPTTSPENCAGGTCLADPVPDEYVPTDEGAVPVDRKRLLDIVNKTRARYGRAPLIFDAALEQGATRQASFCSRLGCLQHASGVTEILAQNTSDFNGAIAQWLGSPAHLQILLSTSYRRVGIGVVRDRYGRVWHAVQFR